MALQHRTGEPKGRLRPSRAARAVFTLLILGALGVSGYYFFVGQQPPAKRTTEPTRTQQLKLEPTRPQEEAGGGVPHPGRATGRIQPTPKVGTLIVSSDPTGAKITIDGQSQPDWVTPKTFQDFAVGIHEVTVSKPGYDDAANSVPVEGGKTTSLNPTLSGFGEIKIVTFPSGIEVLIDGQPYGRSPVQATLPVGQHTYTVRRHGVQLYGKTFQIKPGAMTVSAADLGAGAAVSTATPVPPGVTSGYIISVEGNNVQVALGSTEGVQPGTSLALYKASDLDTWVGILEVTRVLDDSDSLARIVTIDSGLKPEFGDTVRVVKAALSSGLPQEPPTVNFVTIPPGAHIMIDGNFAGITPSRRQVTPGRHSIELRLSGYRTYTGSMRIDEGSHPGIHVSLEKE